MTGPSVRRAAGTIAIGVVGGFTLGVAARAWMRLISDDPEFSWSGTTFIVLGFTVFGLAQSIARLTRLSTRRWVPTVGRAIGVVGLLPLFVGAGGIMAPTVIFGGLASARRGASRWVRVVFAALACVSVVMVGKIVVGDFGWSLHSLAGMAVLIAIYTIIVRVAMPTFAARADGRRLPIRVTVAGLAAMGTLFVLFAVGARF